MKRGITLMEVLVSIAVLSVGFLGLMSLLPVARFFMADGSKYDHMAVVGQRALKELEIRRELMDPSNWYAPAGNGAFLWVCPPAPAGWPQSWITAGVNAGHAETFNYQWGSQASFLDVPAFPFVVDPLGCSYPSNLAANANFQPDNSAGSSTYAHDFGPAFFPPSSYSLDFVNNQFAAPALSRITVPGIGGAKGTSIRSPLSFAAASRIFQTSDDLVFDFPSDQSQRPTQALPAVMLSGAAADVKYSTSNGDYTWFATIEAFEQNWHPGFTAAGLPGSWGDMGVDDDNDGWVDDVSEAGWISASNDPDVALWTVGGRQKFKVTAVVVQKRNLQLQTTSPGDVPPERMVYCDFLSAPLPIPATFIDPTTGNLRQNVAGLGGGDCLLHIPATLPSGVATSPEWLDVKPNQWIMVSAFPDQRRTVANPPSEGQIAKLAWFRISAASDTVRTGGGFQRIVTLTGPDWNPYSFVDAIGATGGFQTAYATIVDGACGAIEATIEQGE